MAVACLFAAPAWASPGHDHADEAPAATAVQSFPRFAAVSETFELVGVLNGKQLTLYLDRFDDNSPVRGAQIELEIGTATLRAEPLGEDAYTATLPEAPGPGVLPITATLTAGDETDLLAGELDLHEAAHTEPAAHKQGWTELAGWGAGGALVLLLLVWGGRRLAKARGVRAGSAA